MSRREAQAFAGQVSRLLAKAGERPIPSGAGRGREGIHVSAGSVGRACSVSVDHDNAASAKRRCDRLIEILTDAGYELERSADNRLLVTRV